MAERQTPLSRVDVEISIGWATEHPLLFKGTYDNFFNTYEKGYTISASVTKGFLTLTAIENEEGKELKDYEQKAFDKLCATLGLKEVSLQEALVMADIRIRRLSATYVK